MSFSLDETSIRSDPFSSFQSVFFVWNLPSCNGKTTCFCDIVIGVSKYSNEGHFHRQVKISDIIFRRFGDFMTPLSTLQMRIKLTNARSRVTTQSDLHSGGGYTNTLARIESACTFKLGVNCLM